MDQTPSIHINGVDINWQPEQGTFTFFGLPSALFWINPSLFTMLKPLADEVGHKLFCLEVAASASQGTAEDYNNMVTVLGDTFEEGFLKWGTAVSAAGWGTFEIISFEPGLNRAKVRVSNAWELLMQKDADDRWGCPFIQGKIIGIFKHALNTNCWADEVEIDYQSEQPYVVFDIYESDKTISQEIKNERLRQMQERERELALDIEAKTKALHEEKIRAEAASYAKSKFLTSISHELNTPLNAVIGFSQILQCNLDNNLTESQLSYAEHIHEAGNNMRSMVEQLLSFSEVCFNEKNIELEPFSATPIVKEAIEMITPLASKRAINISNHYRHIPNNQVMANRNYAKEIIVVFLSNAAKYIQEQGSIEICNEIIDDKFERILVKDNGPGITEDNIDKLFIPFERLQNETGNISGAGIGLSVAKVMSECMHGSVGFKNNSPQGATFWLDLPLHKS